MPFINPGVTINQYLKMLALVLIIFGTFTLGKHNGREEERGSQKSLIDPNVQVLLTKAPLPSFNPNDVLLWSAFLPKAKTCYNCNALREFHNKLYYNSLPIVFQVNGAEVGDTSAIAYTMVFGVVSEDTRDGGQQTLPRIVYYVGYQSGSLVRIDEDSNVQYRIGPDQWEYTWDPNAKKQLMTQVRQAFQKKWQNELASKGLLWPSSQ